MTRKPRILKNYEQLPYENYLQNNTLTNKSNTTLPHKNYSDPESIT